MKLYKTLLYVLMILPALLLQSCLKDQEDIFDTPSSIRMQEVLDNAKKCSPALKKDGHSTITPIVTWRMVVMLIQ